MYRRIGVVAVVAALLAVAAIAGADETATCNQNTKFKVGAPCIQKAGVLRNTQSGQCCHDLGWWEDYASGCKCILRDAPPATSTTSSTRPPGTTTTTSTLPARPRVPFGDNCAEKDGTFKNFGRCVDEAPACGADTANDHRRCHSFVKRDDSRLRNEGEQCGYLIEGAFIRNPDDTKRPLPVGTLVDPLCDRDQGLACIDGICKPGTPVPTVTTSSTSTTSTSTTRPTTSSSSTSSTSTTRPPTSTTSTTILPVSDFKCLLGPYRPSRCDLSLAWTSSQVGAEAGGESGLKWCDICGNVHTCSEYERDTKEWDQVFYGQEIDDQFRDLCPNESGKAWGPSRFNSIFPRLGGAYEGRALATGNVCDVPEPTKLSGGGTWQAKVDGHHYGAEQSVQEDYRKCLMRPANRLACQQRMATNPGARMHLDLNATCTGQHEITAIVTHPKLLEKQGRLKYDAKRAESALIDARATTMAILAKFVNTAASREALAVVGRSHAKASGLPADGTWLDVQTAHINYEAVTCCPAGQCCNESCLHFTGMKRFRGGCAARWNVPAPGYPGLTKCDQWKRLVHHPYHALWEVAQPAGNWCKARVLGDGPHANAHGCMIEENPEMKIIQPCPAFPDHPENCEWGNGQRGPMTCQDALPILYALYWNTDGTPKPYDPSASATAHSMNH